MDTVFKEQCITLRKQGRSIIEIMKITGRAKTSIYTHIQNIPLSTERWFEIKKAAAERIKKFPAARKGKSLRPITRFETWTPETVLLVAHFLFDGEIDRTKCVYNNRSKALVDRVEFLMSKIYDYTPKRYYDTRSGVVKIGYYNVELGTHFIRKSEELLNQIISYGVDLKREFVRAFFDDEGCMDFRPKRNVRQVRGYQKNIFVLEVVKSLLTDFKIESHVKIPNEVVIRGKENLIKFQEEINFSPGVCINGNRSNSIWKESLEKRELLDRAIKSFRI